MTASSRASISPSAATRFAELRATTSPATSPQYLTRDFFELAAEDDHLGAYDLIWDYTFFCALPPGVRDAWASSMERLLKPRGVLVTLMFPLVEGPDVDRDQGPPYPLTRAIYERHLLSTGRRFTLEHVSDSIRSHPGREGRERAAIWRRT